MELNLSAYSLSFTFIKLFISNFDSGVLILSLGFLIHFDTAALSLLTSRPLIIDLKPSPDSRPKPIIQVQKEQGSQNTH